METLTKTIKLPKMNPATVADEIGKFVVSTVLENKATGCVIGLSGGVDSTTTAALIKRAFDTYNKGMGSNILELVGYILPSKTNCPSDTVDGITVAKRLGIRYEEHSIEPLVQAFAKTNPEAFANKYDKGNMTSRIRATVLNTKAAVENKTLAGTGNRDEDYGIGYYTLFGDGAVHMSPIGGLPKRLVRVMARFLGFEDLADRVPTAGLEPGQTDFKDLCYSYDIVELVSYGIDQNVGSDEIIEQLATKIDAELKEYRILYGEPKLTCPRDVVYDIYHRKEVARKKAALIHPATPKITLEFE